MEPCSQWTNIPFPSLLRTPRLQDTPRLSKHLTPLLYAFFFSLENSPLSQAEIWFSGNISPSSMVLPLPSEPRENRSNSSSPDHHYSIEGRALYTRKIEASPKFLWTVVPEKTVESPLDSKEIKPVNLKGDQSWIFTGRTDAEAEAPVFWSSDVNRQIIGKVPGAGKDWGQKEKMASEDEMAGQHHWSNELGQNSGRWWGTRRLGVLQSMGLQRVRHNWTTTTSPNANFPARKYFFCI